MQLSHKCGYFAPLCIWSWTVMVLCCDSCNVFFITMIKEVDCKSRTHAPSMWIVFWIGAASTVAIIFIVVKSANYFLDSLLVWINAIQDSLKSLSLFFLTVKNLEIFHSQSLLQYYEYSMLYLFMVNTLYVVVISSFFFCPSDLESTLSALESVHKFESLLREIYDTDNWRCEQAVVIGEITELLQAWNISHSNIMVIHIHIPILCCKNVSLSFISIVEAEYPLWLWDPC